MNKTELVAAIAEKAGISKKDADAAVAAFVATVTDAMKAGDKVALVGFGTFEARARAARTGINPKTKETIKIAATKVSAGVSTGIGDHESKYTGNDDNCEKGDEQFEINDSRSFVEMYDDILKEGLQPVLNDYLYV